MNLAERSSVALNHLRMARRVADHAQTIGLPEPAPIPRAIPDHLGAVLADCILQAGLNYRSVVKVRVERIVISFPETHRLEGLAEVVRCGTVGEFLQWRHEEKIARFVGLVGLLERHGINDTVTLWSWLQNDAYRNDLLALRGVGPKTVDYLCCLLGMDCVAVDRHLKMFVRGAGVELKEYNELKLVISYAADLLDLPRRQFDTWIWGLASGGDIRAVEASVVSN
jgi:hypothetical protein